MKTSITILRWASKIVGILWSMFFLFFFIADLFSIADSPFNAPETRDLIIFLGTFTGIFGLIYAWWKELTGGIIAVLGTLLIATVRPDLMLTLYATPLLCGLGFILVYLLIKRLG